MLRKTTSIAVGGDVRFRRDLHRWKTLSLSFHLVKTSSKTEITTKRYRRFLSGPFQNDFDFVQNKMILIFQNPLNSYDDFKRPLEFKQERK